MRVVLGVSGGIAAYKACLVLRLLTEAGHEVTVVPTAAALSFVGAPTWEALSGRPVSTSVFDDVPSVAHVRIGQQADLVIVAPATADLLARAAAGMADDLLTATLLAASCPVVMAPAMHTEMWAHSATVANVATLRGRGVTVIEPASGRLTGVDSGPGRLPEPQHIVDEAFAALEHATATTTAGARATSGEAWLAGRRVVVTAGGTREPLDPVRFLGNRSSGKQGFAFAQTARDLGAQVTLIAASTSVEPPADVELVRVESAAELERAVTEAARDADVIVMAAAVADFRPAHRASTKIKKTHAPSSTGDTSGGGVTGTAGVASSAGDRSAGSMDESAPTIELVRTPDILAGLVVARAARAASARGPGESPSPVIIGFAAETGDETGSVLDHARAKLARKGCDVLVANEVGESLTFGADDNRVQVLLSDAVQRSTGLTDFEAGPAAKREVAQAVWSGLRALIARSPGHTPPGG